MAQYEYTLGAAGERTKVEELDRTVEYTYDALYRLTGEKITAADGTVTEYTYAYDNVSNRILKTENGAETTYTYNALNQLTAETGVTYQYDDAGNLISVTSGTKSTLYAYNAENKLIRATVQEGNSVAVEEYEYDYAGNRTVKKSENDYTYYLNDVSSGLTQVLAELDSNGNEKCYYTRGAEIISQERNGAISYYLTDGHGSVRQLTDSTGAVTDTYVYDAWGNLISSTGNTENSYLYCGEQLDSTTGLYYLRARYMNPTTGTFITMDTYQGSIFDPTSLHKYLYANANPVMNVDPSGYFAMALQVEADHDAWAINVGRVLMSKIRNICIQSISAYIPSLIIASSGLAAFVSESPAFADLLSRIASGEVSLYSVQQEINEIIIKAQQFAEQVSDFVNKANNTSSSGGGSGNFDPNRLQELIKKLQSKINEINQRKLQHEFKHAKDFGVNGDWNKENGQRFYNEILEHINNNPNPIQGTYRWNMTVQHYFDPETGIDVMVDMQNNFVCGWRLSEAQIQDLITKGNVW